MTQKTPRRFGPNPRLRKWLRSSGAQEQGAPGDDGSGSDWDGWLLRRMSQGRIVTVGGVLVDRDLLTQRFACVSDRCAPRPGRGPWRSCCADAEVAVDPSEQRRLQRVAKQLPPGWCDAGRLTRPDHRCVFSRIDLAGRIRCGLHEIARRRGVGQSEVQPLSCRLFPLILVDFGEGRTALTLVSPSTWKLVGAHPPRRYPCLADAGLPPLDESLRGDLDWALGRGFGRALREMRRKSE